ncbi:MAG: PAS domain S-box protein [Arcobacteraceae bacterium]|nr:PAS domain S-box protein [Arcobacteraceae bacterium]
MQNKRIDMEDKKFHNLIHSSKKYVTEHYIDRYEYLAKMISNFENVKKYIKTRDREKLLHFFKTRWRILREENPHLKVLHFHLPDGTSFLRVHKPEKYGDRLDQIRPMIKDVHKNKKNLIGYEIGKYGTVFRIVSPIFDKDEYIGAIDIGLDPNFLIKKMKELTKCTCVILVDEKNLKDFKIKSYFTANGFVSQTKIDDKMIGLLNSIDKENIFQDGYKFSYQGKEYTIHLDCLQDYLGGIKVKLLFFEDTTLSKKARWQMLGLFTIFAFLIFFILLFFISKQMNLFEKGLGKIHKKYADDLEHLNGILRVISDVNQNIVKIKEKDLLLENISKTLTANHIFNSVWIALYDKDGHFYKVASDGFGVESSVFKEKLLRDFQPYCMEHIGEKELLAIDSPVKNCGECILKNSYVEDSAIVLKLKYQGKIYGAMGIGVKKEYLHSQRDNNLLTEVAEDIAFALYNIEMEENKNKNLHEIKKLQQVLENSPVSIVITNVDGDIEYVNTCFTKTTGYSFEEVKGKNARVLKSDYYTSDEYIKLWDEITHKHIWSGIFKNVKKNKEEYWESAIIAPVMNDNGDIVNYIGIKQEITEQMYLKEELKNQEKIMLAQSRHAAMGEMISMIAHQWRQPIAIIAMEANNIMADIDLDTVDIEDFEKRAKGIVDQTQHLSHTIDDFRDFFKPDKEKEKTNPKKVVEDTLSVIGKSLENSNIEIIKHIECDCEIFIHSRELLQALLNIIKNAKEALVDNDIKNKKIFITIQKNKEDITIKVCDNAGGIKDEIIDKIFNPYFSTKDEKNGIGLGLYMSKIIIQKHLNGSLAVQNKDDGVCFSIKLPLD